MYLYLYILLFVLAFIFVFAFVFVFVYLVFGPRRDRHYQTAYTSQFGQKIYYITNIQSWYIIIFWLLWHLTKRKTWSQQYLYHVFTLFLLYFYKQFIIFVTYITHVCIKFVSSLYPICLICITFLSYLYPICVPFFMIFFIFVPFLSHICIKLLSYLHSHMRNIGEVTLQCDPFSCFYPILSVLYLCQVYLTYLQSQMRNTGGGLGNVTFVSQFDRLPNSIPHFNALIKYLNVLKAPHVL